LFDCAPDDKLVLHLSMAPPFFFSAFDLSF
jgi:hypothetical protein